MVNNFHFDSRDIQHAHRNFWDADAASYHADHPEYVADFYWCPEMLHERDAQLLGPVASLAGQHILEIGCGSAPCARWLAAASGAAVTGLDLSLGMLQHFEPIPEARQPHLLQADALSLPIASNSHDQVFSAFGAFAFIEDIAAVFAEIARVLKAGGQFTFSTNHPMRWIFPDDPGAAGLTACYSYFEQRPYCEVTAGQLEYVEFHRTIGQWISALTGAGFQLTRVLEPEWPEDLQITWGQWSPLRGQIFPGTIIFQADLPA
ncbi:MAG: class I SAM-dependent methyltransferase [Corynebacterium sp.]|nr:class I SAM-dependent methyltransferase [Corynebacterium sp.]